MKARLAFILVLLSSVAFAAEKLEPAPALSDSVPAAIRNAVEAKGLRVISEASPIADVWLRTTVPAGPKQESGSVLYSQLTPGTFVGVLSFPKGGGDFRGQTIPPGYYTLRYALLPEDGNHMGVAPNRDFLLLVPVAADPGPAVQTKGDDLLKLSAKASATSHPAAMAMAPAGNVAEATVLTNADGYVILSAKMKTSSGDLPFSLVVKGQAAQ